MKQAPIFLLLTALTIVSSMSHAQSSSSPRPTTKQEAAPNPGQDLSSRVPAPKPDDVKSLDSILHAIYDVISGPAGDRDWNRFRSLFVPEARLTSATRRDNGPVHLLDVEGYARGAGNYFKTHSLLRERHRQPRAKIRQHRSGFQQLRIPYCPH